MDSKRKNKISLPLDDDFGAVLICAVRYCIGRRTYMPDLVVSWIERNFDKRMPQRAINVLLRDLNECSDDALGDPCDVKTWHQFAEWLKRQKEILAENGI